MIGVKWLNKSIKQKWCARLRNGQWNQSKANVLRDKDCFCLLGTLCDLFDNRAWTKSSLIKTDYMSFEGYLCVPPQKVIDWAGLSEKRILDLIVQNQKVNFSEAADWIEDHL